MDIQNSNKAVIFPRISSHSEIRGNEKGNKTAENANFTPTSNIKINVLYNDIKTCFKNKMQERKRWPT